MTDQDADGTQQITLKSHSRELPDAYCHMDLSEHVTWMLGNATVDVEYPMEVDIQIKVKHDPE